MGPNIQPIVTITDREMVRAEGYIILRGERRAIGDKQIIDPAVPGAAAVDLLNGAVVGKEQALHVELRVLILAG